MRKCYLHTLFLVSVYENKKIKDKINLYILFKMEITVHNDIVAVITSPG